MIIRPKSHKLYGKGTRDGGAFTLLVCVCVCTTGITAEDPSAKPFHVWANDVELAHTHTHSRGVTTILHSHIVLLLYRQRVKVSSSSLFTLKMYTATIFVITLFRDDDETLNLPVVDECDV
jgi:hypothetical protein